MKILWCERHNLQAEDSEHCEDGTEDAPRDDWCIVVPMRLIPDNAETPETLERFEMVIATWTPNFNHHAKHRFAMELLAALGGETP